MRCHPLVVIAMFVAFVSGCMSSEKGEALQRDVKRLQEQMAEERINTAQLRQVMEKSTALSTRTTADVSVQAEQMSVDIAKLTGRLDEIERTVQQLSKQLTTHVQHANPPALPGGTGANELPEDKEQLYRQGMSNVSGNQHDRGRRQLRHFIAQYPSDARVPQAQVVLGDSYYAQQRFAPAIQEYRKVIERHKKSSVVPDALYKIGMSFYQLKYCSDAASFFRELIKRYPSHRDVAQAKKVLKLIKRFRRNRRICAS